jgi:hypothetical protein
MHYRRTYWVFIPPPFSDPKLPANGLTEAERASLGEIFQHVPSQIPTEGEIDEMERLYAAQRRTPGELPWEL